MCMYVCAVCISITQVQTSAVTPVPRSIIVLRSKVLYVVHGSTVAVRVVLVLPIAPLQCFFNTVLIFNTPRARAC
jgi:hypothetical protein